MKDYEIVNIIPQNEANCLAIVEIMATLQSGDKHLLRYKVTPRKDGSGIFPCTANLLCIQNGEQSWLPCSSPDSNYARENLYREIINAHKIQANSVYTPKQAAYKAPEEEALPF